MSGSWTRAGTVIAANRAGTQISKVVRGTPDATLYTFDPRQKLAIGALIDSYGKNFCTGTLVGDNVVLTAAHCVYGISPRAVRFAIGEDSASPIKTFEVAEIRTNPLWNTRTPEHDNALLFLRESANTYATPIPINREPLVSLVGRYVQNVGYGATDPASSDNTRRWWTVAPVVQLDNRVIVVDGRQVSSVCRGDSGSPCIYKFPNGSLRIIGTLHGGETSCIGIDRYPRTDVDALWLLSGGGVLQQADTPEQQEAFYVPHVPVEQPIRAGLDWLIGMLLFGVVVGVAIGGQLGSRKPPAKRRK